MTQGRIYTLIKGFFLIMSCGLIITIMLLLGTWTDGTKENEVCYKIHLQECLEAHKLNQTLLLCSGFVVEPNEQHLKEFCAIHPLEDCYTNIPKECVV